MPGTVLEAKGIAVSKTDEVPALTALTFYLEKANNKQRNQHINTVLQRNKTVMS